MIKGFLTKIKIFTRLPVPQKDLDDLPYSFPWYPISGAVFGMILFCITGGLFLITGAAYAQMLAFVWLALYVILTGSEYLNGFTRWAGRLGGSPGENIGGAENENCRPGIHGIAALILLLLGKWLFISYAIKTGYIHVLPASVIIARTMIGLPFAMLPYAPETDNGPFIPEKPAKLKHFFAAFTVSLFIIVEILGPAGFFLYIPALIAGIIFVIWSKRRLGGMTSDIPGALCETADLCILACLPLCIEFEFLPHEWYFFYDKLFY